MNATINIDRIEIRLELPPPPSDAITDAAVDSLLKQPLQGSTNRTNPPAQRFRIAADGSTLELDDSLTAHVAVLDQRAGLMWATHPLPERMAWSAADAACEGLALAGFTDWRLPTREELITLVDYSRHNPSIDTALFPDTPANYHWSSSPVASAPDYAWLVYFGRGSVGLHHRDYEAFVRAVRSVPASQ